MSSAETAPDRQTVQNALIEATASVLGLDQGEISPDDRFGDLDVDSVFAIEIILHLGDTLGVAVSPRELLTDWTDLTMRQLASNLSDVLARDASLGPGASTGSGP